MRPTFPRASIDDASLRPCDSPNGPTLTRLVCSVTLSVTKTSIVQLSSAGTRFEASDENTIVRPPALTSAARLAPSASPSVSRSSTRPASAAARSRTNTSDTPFRSSGTRLVAVDGNTRTLPSALIDGFMLGPSLRAPDDEMLARQVRRPTRSRTKTSVTPFRSPGTSDVAPDTKATKRPLPLSTAPNVAPSAWYSLRVLRFARLDCRESDVFGDDVRADRLGLRLCEDEHGRDAAERVDDPRRPPHTRALHRRPSSQKSTTPSAVHPESPRARTTTSRARSRARCRPSRASPRRPSSTCSPAPGRRPPTGAPRGAARRPSTPPRRGRARGRARCDEGPS